MRRLSAVLAVSVMGLGLIAAPARADDADTHMVGHAVGVVDAADRPYFSIDVAGVWDGVPAYALGYSCASPSPGALTCDLSWEGARYLSAPFELSGPYAMSGSAQAWQLTATMTALPPDPEGGPIPEPTRGTYNLSCRGGDPSELVPSEPASQERSGVCELT